METESVPATPGWNGGRLDKALNLDRGCSVIALKSKPPAHIKYSSAERCLIPRIALILSISAGTTFG